MGRPRLIIVSGPAGSGKTTLAHELARAVGCPALCRDELKEGMVVSNPGFVAATSDPLTVRTYGLFFETIALLLRAEVTLVAEAAFQHRLWTRGLEPLADLASLRIVRCRADVEEERRRFVARMTDQATRAAHADTDWLVGSPSSFDAVHLDAPTLDVDTSDGWTPRLEEIASFALG